MRSLILGASGFIGQHLGNYLLGRGEEVTGTCRCRPRPTLIRDLRFHRLNVLDSQSVLRLIRRTRPDFIYHLAGQASVIESWTNPIETLQTNIIGTANVLEAMRRARSKARVLLVSSSTVYGSALEGKAKVREEQPLLPKDPYSISKTSLDFLGRTYASQYGLDVVIIRLFNQIGPGQSTRFSLSNFAYQVACLEKNPHRKKFRVGNIDAKRDFTDVRDGVRAFQLALLKGRRGEVYNLASGKSYSLRELLEDLIALSNVKEEIRILRDPALVPKDEIQDMHVNEKKFQRETRWRPLIPMRTTLSDMLNYWRQNGV